MHLFTLSYVSGQTSDVKTLVEGIQKKMGFAIDEGGKIERQWLDTCGPKPGCPFYEWLYQKLKDGSVRKVPAKLGPAHRKKLRVDCGLPNDRYEMTYIEVANVTDERYIVSEDIHFYEPRLKYAAEAAKARAKSERRGRVWRYLANLGITVGTVSQASAEIL